MPKATKEELWELWVLLLQTLRSRMRDGATAAECNIARQFLRDNGVNKPGATGTKIDQELQDLLDELPEFGGPLVQ